MPLGHASGGEEEEEEEKETSASYSLAQGPLLVVALMCQIEGGEGPRRDGRFCVQGRREHGSRSIKKTKFACTCVCVRERESEQISA